MRKIVLIFFCCVIISIYGKNNETIVVFYFGSNSCGFCDNIDLIKSVKKIRTELPNIYPEIKIKFVQVCMDENIEEGIKFLKKYGYWDEISIGSHYQNELVLAYLSKTKIAGVPHLIIYNDKYSNSSTPVIIKRKIILDKVGVKQIVRWVEDKFPLNMAR
ncbi:MAG: TlpA family protein disulfide reductase [Rhodothermaceae bacterium]